MWKVDKLGVKLFTYDKQDGPSTNQVTFEALLYYPSGGVDIQSSENLMRTAASAPVITRIPRRRRLTSSKIRISAEA
jgi:hypothetical protein